MGLLLKLGTAIGSRYGIIGIALLLLGGSSAWAYQKGYTKAMNKASADNAAVVNEAVNKYKDEVAKRQVVEKKLLETQGKREVEYRTITKEVIKYVQVTPDVQCFNDDGVRLIKDIAAGRALPKTKPGTGNEMPRGVTDTGGGK